MKKRHFIIVISFLLIYGLATSQEIKKRKKEKDSIPTVDEKSKAGSIKDITFEIQDSKGKKKDYNRFKKGDFFRVVINDINTYLYKVEINNEDISNISPLPNNLLSLIDYGGISASLTNLNTVSDILKSEIIKGKETDSLDIDQMIQLFQLIEGGGAEAIARKKDNLEKTLFKLKENYKNYNIEINESHQKINAFFFGIENDFNSIKTLEENLIYDLPSKKDVEDKFKIFDGLKKDILSLKQSLINYEVKLSSTKEVFKKQIEEDENYKLAVSELTNLDAKLKEAVDGLYKMMSIENYTKVSQGLIDIINNLNFTYKSLPIQRFDDQNKIEIKITARDENSKIPEYITTLIFPDVQKQFWGVSTGFYLAKNLEENYSIVERLNNDNQVVYDFVEEDNSKEELGINTMVRYGLNITKNYNKNIFWHFGFGAGLTINEKVKPRLFLGNGIAIGGKNKLVFDFGLIYMFYDKLSNAYELQDNPVKPENFLVNATQLRGYFSLGYTINLSKSSSK